MNVRNTVLTVINVSITILIYDYCLYSSIEQIDIYISLRRILCNRIGTPISARLTSYDTTCRRYCLDDPTLYRTSPAGNLARSPSFSPCIL